MQRVSETVCSISGILLIALGTFLMWFGGWKASQSQIVYSIGGILVIGLGTFLMWFGGWKSSKALEGHVTGGDTFCYWMLYDFDLAAKVAKQFVVIREGSFPLYDVRMRIVDLETSQERQRGWGEINAPAEYLLMKWALPRNVYYRVFFSARNGSWRQDLILKKSESAKCWLAATRVFGKKGEVRFEHLDNDFNGEFGSPVWRQ
jgi:uncharacterized membrane protein